MSEIRFKISPPWVLLTRKLEALFDPDPMIAFNIDYGAEGGPSVVLSTNDGEKAAALVKILPEEINYGGVVLHVSVDCPHMANLAFPNNKVLFETAFKGNPIFAYAMSPYEEGYNWMPMVYVVFKNRVVQFFADNLNDCHGIISTLYQEIADEIFGYGDTTGVFFNTDVEVGQLGKPLGEWP